MSLFYFLNKSSLVISKWQYVIIMINSFELTDKCPQAIKIIWWNEHFEIPHLQIIATQQMLTSSRMRSKWKCTLCANYCWKIDIQIKLTFFLSFLKEFTVSREYKTICNLKKKMKLLELLNKKNVYQVMIHLCYPSWLCLWFSNIID